MDGVFCSAYLQTLGISWGSDRTHIIGQVTETLLTPGQRHNPALGKLSQHVLTDLAIQHMTGMLQVAEQERNIEHAGLGHKVQGCAGRDNGQINCAQLQAFNDFTLATQGAVGEGLDGVIAILFQGTGKGLCTRTIVRAGGQGVGQLQGRLSRSRPCSQAQAQHQTRGQKTVLHVTVHHACPSCLNGSVYLMRSARAGT